MKGKPAPVHQAQIDKVPGLVQVAKRTVLQIVKGNSVLISQCNPWNDFLDKKVDSIEDIMTPTPYDGLNLIGGDSSRLGSENLPYSQKRKIMRHLREMKGDYLILDLGGNSSYNALDFFLFADHKIVVSGTEPASILDSYSFVKVAAYRFLERSFSEHKSLKNFAQNTKNNSSNIN